MADGVSVSPLLKSQQRQSKQNPPPPATDFRSRFLFRALLAIFFFIFMPILPSIAPEFFNQNLFSQSWELLHIVFVGIAVSYGLFSRRYDDSGGEVHPKPDSAQSYVSRLLQASSVFEDDIDSPTGSSFEDDGGNKVQTWSSQYFRNEPVVVVAKEKQSSVISRDDDHKPLLLPVRSLKSRVSDENGGGESSRVSGRSCARSRSYNSSSTQKEPSNREKKIRNRSLKSRSSDFNSFSGNLNAAEFGFSESNPNSSPNGAPNPHTSTETLNEEQSVVLPSPIPWRSRSGRLEKKEDDDPPMEEMDPNPSRWTSNSLPMKPFPAPACLFESNSKRSEDFGRKRTIYRSPPPPPPPPPIPPPLSFYNKPPLAKSRTVIADHGNDKNKLDYSSSVKSCRTVRSDRNWKEAAEEEELRMAHDENSFSDYTNEAGHEDFLGEIHAMSEDEDDDDEEEEFREVEKQENFKEESNVAGVSSSTSVDDEGPDVDKKADEFIAKFREQIRLQRIESIKRSTGQLSRSSVK
ncbi:hypothetical protein V2J09_002646 [Rumex salicifolius]